MRSPKSRRSAAQAEVPAISPMMAEILERVEHFSDLELRKELSARSFSCGPIVGTTRGVYKKKLIDMLLDEELPTEARAARAAPSSEEDEEEEEVETQPKYVNGGRTVSSALGVPKEDKDEEEEEEEEEEEAPDSPQEESSEEEAVDDEESQEDTDEIPEASEDIVSHAGGDVLRHRLPGPSDSFETKTSVAFVSEDGKTVKRTTTTTTRVMKATDLQRDSEIARSTPTPLTTAQVEKPKKKSSCLSILFQLIVIAIIVFFVYVIVMGPSTPLGLPAKPHDVENPPSDDGAD